MGCPYKPFCGGGGGIVRDRKQCFVALVRNDEEGRKEKDGRGGRRWGFMLVERRWQKKDH